MDRQIAFVERMILRLLAVLLALITLGVFTQVVLRYAVHKSFLWGEELSLFGFIWCIYLGAVVNVRRRTNFAFEFLTDLLPGRVGVLHRMLVDVIILACCLVIMREGWTFSVLSLKRLSPALGISLFMPSVVIPLSAALMVVVVTVHLWRSGHALRRGEA